MKDATDVDIAAKFVLLTSQEWSVECGVCRKIPKVTVNLSNFSNLYRIFFTNEGWIFQKIRPKGL